MQAFNTFDRDPIRSLAADASAHRVQAARQVDDFRLVRSMFAGEATEKAPVTSSLGLRFALAASGIMTLLIGIYPEPFLQLAQKSLLR